MGTDELQENSAFEAPRETHFVTDVSWFILQYLPLLFLEAAHACATQSQTSRCSKTNNNTNSLIMATKAKKKKTKHEEDLF